jgi:hypothetical protein
MFSLFQDNSPDAEKKRAADLFEKVVASKADTREARSARIRMALLCRAHLDKTFVAGAEMAETHDTLAALALAQGTTAPETPPAPLFHEVSTGQKTVYAYLPSEYAEVAFAIGARYQRMEINAQQAIEAMQGLANQLFLYEFRLDDPLQVLQFLRDEIAGVDAADAPPSLNNTA